LLFDLLFHSVRLEREFEATNDVVCCLANDCKHLLHFLSLRYSCSNTEALAFPPLLSPTSFNFLSFFYLICLLFRRFVLNNTTRFDIEQSLAVNLNYESGEHRKADNADAEQPAQGIAGLLRQTDSSTTAGAAPSTSGASVSINMQVKPNQARRNVFPYQVRKGVQKRPAGFQAELVILTPWPDEKTPPQKITSVAIFAACNL
jgi:hypothetical protein